MARMKLRELETHLQAVRPFAAPKLLLEQYPTSAHIAACMLHTAQSSFGDVEGRMVADLGCGCGVLAAGLAMLGAAAVVAVDVDEDALAAARENLCELELAADVDLVAADVRALAADDDSQAHGVLRAKSFDTVVMNPPFGTKHNRGIDLAFVRAGLRLATSAVYSLHKTSTRNHIVKKARQWGVHVQVIAELRYALPHSYKHHSKSSVDIDVDFVRFSFEPRRS